MDRKAMLAVGGCLALLVGLGGAIVIYQRGLDSYVRAAYEAEAAELARATQEVQRCRAALDAALAAHTDVLEPLAEKEGWDARLTEAETAIQEVRSRYDAEAKPIFVKNERADGPELGRLLEQLEAQRARAVGPVAQLRQRVQELADFLGKREQYLTQARTDAKRTTELDLSAIQQKVSQAQRHWPDKQVDLTQRLESLQDYPQQAQALLARVEAEDQKSVEEIQPQVMFDAIRGLGQLPARLTADVQQLGSLVDQLYTSWDKTLVDMEIREGYTVTFRHRYKTLKLTLDPAQVELDPDAAPSASPQISTSWEDVDEATFKRYEQNLGMSVATKPLGKYDSEATSIATPPGYAYVGNPYYGTWVYDDDDVDIDIDIGRKKKRKWRWHPRASYVSSYYYGSSSRPIYHSDYDRYDRSYRSGKVYYGQDRHGLALYGSKGHFTRTTYGSSSYVRNDGYKNTKYKQSGGSFRGSKYTSSSRSSSSGGYSSSRYSSSSSSSSSYRRGSRSSSSYSSGK